MIQTHKYYWINKLLSEENKIQEHRRKLEGWQGPPHINNVKQHETVFSFRVSLLILFV